MQPGHQLGAEPGSPHGWRGQAGPGPAHHPGDLRLHQDGHGALLQDAAPPGAALRTGALLQPGGVDPEKAFRNN